jgi:DNA-binding FadR family transcriptional regulator
VTGGVLRYCHLISGIRSSKLHEQLVAQICREIVSGSLPAGRLIPSEPQLIATHSVSKTVVRETVQALAALGLVRVQHGKRSVVLPETEWNILSPAVQEAFRAERLARPLVQELYDVRLVLEPRAARWTAERRSAAHCKQLDQLIDVMAKSLRAPQGGVAAFLEYDRDFHLAIASASANRVLRAIVRDIHELVTTSWLLTDLTSDDLDVAFEHHSMIASAIIDRDGPRAESVMSEHLQWAADQDSRAGRELDAVVP